MNRFSFFAAKLIGSEDHFCSWSKTFAEITQRAEGKIFSVVGNARNLAKSNHGDEIDRSDIVVRLNQAPIPNYRSHGTRTDWIATSTPLDRQLLDVRQPDLVLWMTSKRKRLPWRLVNHDDFFINPVLHHRELFDDILSRPTTGLLAIDLLRRTTAAEIHIFGFDFFQSQSLSGSRRAEDVVHDFASERAWIQRLSVNDSRFHFHEVPI